MSDVRIQITCALPNEPTPEQREAAAVDAGDPEAHRRLDNAIEQEHAELVRVALQKAMDQLADDLPMATGLVAGGTVDSVVLSGIQPSPPSASQQRRTERKEVRAAEEPEPRPKVQPTVQRGTATTATARK